jgi:hypothetical protein
VYPTGSILLPQEKHNGPKRQLQQGNNRMAVEVPVIYPSSQQSRNYLYCGEAITHAAQVTKLRNCSLQPFIIRNIIIACPTRPAEMFGDLDD